MNGSVTGNERRSVPSTPIGSFAQFHDADNGEELWKGKGRDNSGGGERGVVRYSILYATCATLLECTRKKAVSGVYWNINFFLLAVQVCFLSHRTASAELGNTN